MSVQFDHLPDSALLRVAQLPSPEGPVPLKVPTIWKWVRDGKFPKPVKLDGNITAWRWGEVRAWLDAQGTKEAA